MLFRGGRFPNVKGSHARALHSLPRALAEKAFPGLWLTRPLGKGTADREHLGCSGQSSSLLQLTFRASRQLSVRGALTSQAAQQRLNVCALGFLFVGQHS